MGRSTEDSGIIDLLHDDHSDDNVRDHEVETRPGNPRRVHDLGTKEGENVAAVLHSAAQTTWPAHCDRDDDRADWVRKIVERIS